ncbi:tyrosine-type recombinase/integrase [Comamonas testosteroni]|uniref:tyrosine-type recombinase/integrase n=1 Tax=Comamonas testosteroni TaxID=285 RepID=UPI00391895B2
MAVIQRGARFQARIKSKLLPGGITFQTFDSEDEAARWEAFVKASLAAGKVPAEILAGRQRGVTVVGGQPVYSGELVHNMLALYGAENKSISDADRDMLPALYKYIPDDVRTTDVDFDFAMQLVTHLRATLHLAPSTIRARIGCLSRAWKWFHAINRQHSVVNPFDLLPHGYSIPNREEQEKILKDGGDVNLSSGRERRLEPGEEDRILLAMNGQPTVKLQRAMPSQPELKLLFELIINTGLRLREAYKIKLDDVKIFEKKGFIAINTSKGHRGRKRRRAMPLIKQLREQLVTWIEGLPEGTERLFPGLWDGSENEHELKKTTMRVSARMSTIFRQAGVENITEHDLRHEGCCRWFSLKKADGSWVFHEGKIVKIMGWTSSALVPRYLSLRGDLADDLEDAGL